MWESLEKRVEDNNARRSLPIRIEFLEIIRNSNLGLVHAVDKMASMEFGNGDRILWELTSPVNFYLAKKWRSDIQGLGFEIEDRRFIAGEKDGARHSGLSRNWSFGSEDCFVLRVPDSASLARLIDFLQQQGSSLMLSSSVVDSWVGKLKKSFPNLQSFEKNDPAFDETERNYKLCTGALISESMSESTEDEQLEALVLAALNPNSNNLIDWRVTDKVKKTFRDSEQQLTGHFRELLGAGSGDPTLFPSAVEKFVTGWMSCVPAGSEDEGRQLAEYFLFHMAPDKAIYIRKTVRNGLWKESVGSDFPQSGTVADAYRNELRFMSAVRDAFVERGLEPRDMIDVQSALWVIHNYDSNEVDQWSELDIAEQSKESNTTRIPTTNLILYGPPGTGKTYGTAYEAVRLCMGTEFADSFKNDRPGLMKAYKTLVNKKQVEFLTFHQSMSYEEFVEGLRPTTDQNGEDDGSESNQTGGFRLVARPGIFKEISDRARLDRSGSSSPRLDRTRAVYKIALGQRGQEESRILEGLDGGFIHLGWGGDIDWSDERFDDFNEIRKKWREEKDPSATGKAADIEMTFALRSGLQLGDYVVLSDGRDKFRALGKVVGPYEFEKDASFHPHRRKVEWIWRDDNGVERSKFYEREFRRHSLYGLARDAIDWDRLEAIVYPGSEARPKTAKPHVLIIDEINRANISKVFGELITLLEPDKRIGQENEITVSLPYSGRPFGVPENLHIIGTMNTADRSIALLDTALRRRFEFKELMPNADSLREALGEVGVNADNLDGINLCRFLDTINTRIEYLFDREHQIGHAYFTGCRSKADIENVVRSKVIPLLQEYFYEDWSKVAAVLGDVDGNRFLEVTTLSPPPGFGSDDMEEGRKRWKVRDTFDFSDFEA